MHGTQPGASGTFRSNVGAAPSISAGRTSRTRSDPRFAPSRAGSRGDSIPAAFQLVPVAKLVYPKDRALAQDIARAIGETLESLGLEKPAAPVAPAPVYQVTPQHLPNTLLCAAAEALDMSPHAMRPALAAMLRTMRELGVSAAVAEEGLRSPEPPATKPRRAAT